MNRRSPGLFLDRDGVINKDYGFVHTKQEFEFMPGIFELCLLAMNAGMKIVIITNQSGIGRGYFTHNQFEELMKWVLEEFKKQGVKIEGVFYAPENPEMEPLNDTPSRRKPSPAMFLEASNKFSIDLKLSLMIGDRESDMVAAADAGVKNRILLGAKRKDSAATEAVFTLKDALISLRKFISDVIGDG